MREVETGEDTPEQEVCGQNLNSNSKNKVRLGCNNVNIYVKGNEKKTTFGNNLGQNDSWNRISLGTELHQGKLRRKLRRMEPKPTDFSND